MIEFLFNAERFVPRGQCGLWAPGWGVGYEIANFLIFLAYFLIAAFLVIGIVMPYSARDIEAVRAFYKIHTRMIGMVYALFIGLCGIGHLLDGVLAFHSALYHFLTVYHSITAIVSLWAAWVTFRLRHSVLMLR